MKNKKKLTSVNKPSNVNKPNVTLAGTALISIQNPNHDTITIKTSGI